MPLSNFGALIVVDPNEAKRRLLAAIDDAQGNRSRAAEAMGVPLSTLKYWILRLGMYPAIDALCERKGYDVHRGAPRAKPRRVQKGKR